MNRVVTEFGSLNQLSSQVTGCFTNLHSRVVRGWDYEVVLLPIAGMIMRDDNGTSVRVS